MEIKHISSAGTLESSDCMVTVSPSDAGELKIEIESIVMTTFGGQIRAAVEDVLRSFDVSSAEVSVIDKGAIDCVIRARTTTAVCRAAEVKFNWEGLDSNG